MRAWLFGVWLLGCSGGAAVPDAWVDTRPDGRPCTADCECGSTSECCQPLGGPGECYQCGRLDVGLCGIDGLGALGCGCVGGTCDERHCCILPDGAIDDGSGFACTAPDAGVTDASPRP